MRTLFHKACAVMGGIVFLAGAAFVGDSLALAAAWLAVSVSLLFAGRAFSFQQKQIMNTATTITMRPAAAVPTCETLVDYPSEYITGLEDRPVSLDAYTLTKYDMKCIFEELRNMIDRDSRGDVDGEQYDLDYKMFRIEAIHHYECHEERGGDSYYGVCESYGIIDVDRIQIVRVFDEDGKEYLGWVNKLNYYAKQNNI